MPSKKNLQGLHAKPRGQNERRWQPCCREECGDPQQLKKNCLISGKSLELSKYTSCIFVISVQSPAVIYSCRRPAKCMLLLPVLLLCAPQPCLTLGSVFRGRSSPAQQILIVHEGVWHLWPCDLLRYRRATPSKNKLDTSRAGPAVFPPRLPHGAAGRNGNIHSCGVNLCCAQRCCTKHNAGGSGDFPAPSAASSHPGKLDVHYRPDERIMEVPWLGRG